MSIQALALKYFPIVLAMGIAGAQSPPAISTPTVLGAGYSLPLVLHVAPGQVITLYVTGLSTVTGTLQAKMVPVPPTLGSISASLSHGAISISSPVPILSLQPVSPACRGSLPPAPCGSYTAVTVQLPWDLTPNVPFSDYPPTFETLHLAENAQPATSVTVYGEYDQIHVLRSADTVFIPGADLLQASEASLVRAPTPLVFHPDGSPVTPVNPAHGGEGLTLYAVGLLTLMDVLDDIGTGGAPKAPYPVATPAVAFDFRPNAGPSRPAGAHSNADYAGLVAGFVGLFQVNVTIPPVPANISLCDNDPRGARGYPSGVTSNLTISIWEAASIGGAQICVAPQP